ncbi:MAG: regulatory iron-sulfur-containing complex subunit RicT [Candidatus Parcubacteria bacterium]|nr:regulatory iron-sulfur-containing complex subunit RicT [Candidatus Parcubacteria bacterium]
MKVVEIQLNLWDRIYYFLGNDLILNHGDYVVVEANQNLEVGKVVGFKEMSEKEIQALPEEEKPSPVIRKATLSDLEVLESNEKQKESALEVCKKMIEKNKLEMKLVDAQFSFDGKKVTFAFIADGRIDFRSLVKDLTRHFQKNIRLQQLGVRDEAKINGDIGACGITQCCKTHLKLLGNVNAEQAELQQVSHRGAERLSGICGRLKCCLRYENDLYKELSANFPALGSIVKTPRGKGEVVEWHILKQTVNVRLEEDKVSIVEVPLANIKH